MTAYMDVDAWLVQAWARGLPEAIKKLPTKPVQKEQKSQEDVHEATKAERA